MVYPIGAFRNKNCLVADYESIRVAKLAAWTRWNSLLCLNQDTPRTSFAATVALAGA
jgi:hypothetical protein